MIYFIKNFEFLYREAGRSKLEFCDDVKLSIKTFDRWKRELPNFQQQKTSGKIDEVVAELNRILQQKKFPSLSNRFKNEITRTMLLEQDLRQYEDPSIKQMYFHKLIGDYYVYHLATQENAEQEINYGLLRIKESVRPNEFECEATFHLTEKPRIDSWTDRPYKYTGKAYTSGQTIWFNFVNSYDNEFVSVSFELSTKIFSKNADTPFVGTRGTAMSQTTGTQYHTIVYPMIISTRPWNLPLNQLQSFLTFRVKNFNSDSISIMASRVHSVISLIDDIIARNDKDNIDSEIAQDMIRSLVNGLVKRVYTDSAPSLCRFDDDSQTDLYEKFFKVMKNEIAEEIEKNKKGDKQ